MYIVTMFQAVEKVIKIGDKYPMDECDRISLYHFM